MEARSIRPTSDAATGCSSSRSIAVGLLPPASVIRPALAPPLAPRRPVDRPTSRWSISVLVRPKESPLAKASAVMSAGSARPGGQRSSTRLRPTSRFGRRRRRMWPPPSACLSTSSARCGPGRGATAGPAAASTWKTSAISSTPIWSIRAGSRWPIAVSPARIARSSARPAFARVSRKWPTSPATPSRASGTGRAASRSTMPGCTARASGTRPPRGIGSG